MPHAQAAINGNHGTADVACCVGGEEEGYVGDFLGFGEAFGGDGVGVLLFEVIGEGFGHVGFDEAGGDDVGGDVAGAEFAGDGAGHADEAGFGGGVVDLAGVAVEADDGGDVDDAAAFVFEEALGGALGDAEGTGEVGVNDGGEVVFAHAHEEGVFGDACVGDDDADRAVFCFYGGEGGIDGGGVGDVCLDGEEFLGGLAGAVGDGDVVPCVFEGGGDGVANAAVAAGDEDGLGLGHGVSWVVGLCCALFYGLVLVVGGIRLVVALFVFLRLGVLWWLGSFGLLRICGLLVLLVVLVLMRCIRLRMRRRLCLRVLVRGRLSMR